MNLLHEPLSRQRTIALGVVGVVGSAAVAELILRSGLVGGTGLPMPSTVLSGASRLFADSEFWSAIGFTLVEWLIALVMATVAGVVIGGLMGSSRAAFLAFEWPVEAFRVLPSIALGPLLILVLGAGMLPLSVTVAIACVWPILLNTMYGVRSTDSTAVQTARTFGANDLEILWHIKIPSALPFAFTGFRVAASIGLIVAVSSELLIGNGSGIGGYILIKSANATSLDVVYAATLVAGVVGVLANLAFALLDNRVLGWKKGLAQ